MTTLYYKHQTGLRLDLNYSQHEKEMIIMCCDRSAMASTAVLLQHINVSDQHVLPLKFTQCYCQIYFT